jgi:hypothetical protein
MVKEADLNRIEVPEDYEVLDATDHGRPAVTRHALQQHLCYPLRVLPNLGALLTTSTGSQHFGSFEYLGLCRVPAEGSLRSGGMA